MPADDLYDRSLCPRHAEEKEEAEKRKAKQEHKATRLAAAERMGVQAPKRLKKKAKKGVRIKKHVVVRVSGEFAVWARHGCDLGLLQGQCFLTVWAWLCCCGGRSLLHTLVVGLPEHPAPLAASYRASR